MCSDSFRLKTSRWNLVIFYRQIMNFIIKFDEYLPVLPIQAFPFNFWFHSSLFCYSISNMSKRNNSGLPRQYISISRCISVLFYFLLFKFPFFRLKFETALSAHSEHSNERYMKLCLLQRIFGWKCHFMRNESSYNSENAEPHNLRNDGEQTMS